MQCCIFFKWFHLRCLLLSFSKFNTLGSSLFWSCSPCCIQAFFGDCTPTNSATSSSDSSSLYTFTVLLGSFDPPANAALPPYPRLQTSYIFLPTWYLLPVYPYHRLMMLAVSLYILLTLFLYSSGFFNGMLEVSKPAALNYYTLFRLILFNFVFIQESNPNSSSSLRIPVFSALRSDRTHSRSGILSPDTMHASGGVIIFVRQSFSFFKLSTSNFLSLIMLGSTSH